jgi:hypothetical protein
VALCAKENASLADSRKHRENLNEAGKLMYNNIGGSNLISSDGYDLLRTKFNGHHENDIDPKAVGESFFSSSVYSAKAEFYVASVNEDGGYKILAQALSVEYSSATDKGGITASPMALSSFMPPSPLDVANKVLGFVANRVSSELEAGAGSERISSLITQAREGVQKGFSQAREDIESLGLMTNKLDKEIGKGFDRIDSGLTEIEGRFLGTQQAEASGEVVTQFENQPVNQAVEQPGVLTKGVSVLGTQAYQELVNTSGSGVEGARTFSRSSYVNSSEFSLKTQDGDTITIRYDDAGSEVFKSAGNKLFAGQSQYQGYQLEVNGELDEDELAAISDLFAQLGEVSSKFFGGDFQDAFASALEVGFDASEIASFSLDLSKAQTQEVSTYSNGGNVYEQGVGAQGAIQKNQPLIDMTALFEKSLELLKSFDDQQFDFRALVMASLALEAAEKEVVSKVSQNDFSDFTEKIIEQLAA